MPFNLEKKEEGRHPILCERGRVTCRSSFSEREKGSSKIYRETKREGDFFGREGKKREAPRILEGPWTSVLRGGTKGPGSGGRKNWKVRYQNPRRDDRFLWGELGPPSVKGGRQLNREGRECSTTSKRGERIEKGVLGKFKGGGGLSGR